MSRLYAVPINGTYAAANGDHELLYITPADDKPIALLGWSIGQYTEAGDAAAENIRLTLRHLGPTVTASSGGNSVTPVNVQDVLNGVAAGFTARTMDGTVATTSGTSTTVENRGWNELSTPWEWIYPDESWCLKARQGEAIVLRGETTVADDVSIAGTAWVLEYP